MKNNSSMSNTHVSMSCGEIANILTASLVGEDVIVKGISTDTRTISGGELFIALKGENFDGHDYVDEAVRKGAVACLVEKSVESNSFIVVSDTLKALGQLSHYWRNKFNIPVVAITGSNGKTTVKEMVASIANEKFRTLATLGNLNNEIGVPLTLFRLSSDVEFAVIEMGANHHGEIAYLTEIAAPDIALVTNAGSAHLEGFGSLEGVATAKSEIYGPLNENGYAIINNDDVFSDVWKEKAKGKNIITFGIKNKSDVMAEWSSNVAGSKLSVTTPKGHCEIKLKLLGQHNVMNALSAIAVATAADFTFDQIVHGLEKLEPVKGRLQVKKGINDSVIIDDTYNANPTSLNAALSVLRTFPGKHYLALGDMGELGVDSIKIHEDAGLHAKNENVDCLFTLGELAAHAARSFKTNAYQFEQKEEMIKSIKEGLCNDVTLLVKGSRRMGMENIVDALTVQEK